MPLVSVIIPFLNGGLWLSEAVNSVLAQSYYNWEIILIDDGSDEKDTHIAKALVELCPEKMIYMQHEGHRNRGLTASRNAGIKLSAGSLIALLDADDYWLPEKLHSQVSLFNIHRGAAMICESSFFWYSWRDSSADNVFVPVGAKNGALFAPPVLQEKLYPLGEGAAPCPSGIMIRRKAFESAGGFEESFCGELQLYEDQAFLTKIYLNEPVYISEFCNNLYRKRPDSMSSAANNPAVYKRVRLFYLDWLEKYISSQRIRLSSVQPLIDKARRELEAPV